MASLKFLTLVSGLKTLVAAITTSAGVGDANKIVGTGSDGKLHLSLMPNGIGADVWTGVCSENLVVGPVNIFDDAGTVKARKADATAAGKEANGFVTASATSGDTVDVYLDGTITGLTGLTEGATYFLDTTAGAITTTAPSTSGNIVQQIGKAISETALIYEPSTPITLAA